MSEAEVITAAPKGRARSSIKWLAALIKYSRERVPRLYALNRENLRGPVDYQISNALHSP